jgi:DNA-binding transcriptional ArsR family regulator
MNDITPIFTALSDPCRLSIIENLMRDGETPAGTISEMYDISGPAISRHLSILHDAGLVQREIAGKQRLYSVRPEAIQKISNWTLDHRAFWETSLDRIARALTEESFDD